METKTGVAEGPTRGSAYVKSMSKLYDGKSRASQRQPNFRVPNDDRSGSLYRFTSRCDESAGRPNYRRETAIVTPVIELKYKGNDAADIKSREPSFAKFKTPYEMICAKRYSDWKRTYEAQLEHEINQNIDFQKTAADACYFVRCMSITTLWPPLHNMTEVKNTSQHFFQLTEKEKMHLKYIMDTDIT